MNWTRWKYLAAMMLIGDGVLAFLSPRRDALTWNAGPERWKALMGSSLIIHKSHAPSEQAK